MCETLGGAWDSEQNTTDWVLIPEVAAPTGYEQA